MTARQKIELRRSEIRQRLGEISALEGEARAEAVETEQRGLMQELRDSESRLQAAIAAEETDTRLRGGQVAGDGEGAEIRELRQHVHVQDYVGAALQMRGVAEAAAEYNAALEIEPHRFPMSLLAPEVRATTDADATANQSVWIDRLFAETLAAYLGITFEAAGPGVSNHPVTTAGAAGAQLAREAAAGDSVWTVGVAEMKPKRNTVRAVFTSEDAARLPGLEDALTRDLRLAVTEAVDEAIFTGAGADIVGLRTAASVAERTLTQAAKVKGVDTLAEFLALVDGIHASELGQLRIVSSVGSNVLWGSTVLPSPVTTGETVAQFLMRAGLMWRTRDGIDANTADGDFGAYIGRQRGIMGAGVSAVWDSGELIRDPYSGASKGQVALTLNYLWDFALPRASNFARLKYVA